MNNELKKITVCFAELLEHDIGHLPCYHEIRWHVLDISVTRSLLNLMCMKLTFVIPAFTFWHINLTLGPLKRNVNI